MLDLSHTRSNISILCWASTKDPPVANNGSINGVPKQPKQKTKQINNNYNNKDSTKQNKHTVKGKSKKKICSYEIYFQLEYFPIYSILHVKMYYTNILNTSAIWYNAIGLE